MICCCGWVTYNFVAVSQLLNYSVLISAENPAVWEKEVLPWAEVTAKAGDKRIACSLDSYLRLDGESSSANRGKTKDS